MLTKLNKEIDDAIVSIYKRKFKESPFMTYKGVETGKLTEAAIKRFKNAKIDYDLNKDYKDLENGVFLNISVQNIKITDEDGEW